jgi:hypothetical protein
MCLCVCVCACVNALAFFKEFGNAGYHVSPLYANLKFELTSTFFLCCLSLLGGRRPPDVW